MSHSCSPSQGPTAAMLPRTNRATLLPVAVGLRTTATIMFGHVEAAAGRSWAAHLVALRELQRRHSGSGGAGFSEFVPLPFVHFEAPIYLKGAAALR